MHTITMHILTHAWTPNQQKEGEKEKCPRHTLMKYDTPSLLLIRYELRDIQREKLKQMAVEDEKSSDNNPYEVEMAEANHENFIEPLPPS